jgi:hypothetical protein
MVEQGQGQHQPVLRVPAPGQAERLGAGQQVAVGQDGPLGGPGGPGGVAEQGRVAGAGGVKGRRVAVGQADLGPGDQQVATGGAPRPAAPVRVVDHGRPRPGVADDVGHLALPVGGVDRHHHQAHAQRAEVGHDQVHGGGRADQQPVPGGQPGPGQPPGHPGPGRLQVAAGPPARPLGPQGRAAGVIGGQPAPGGGQAAGGQQVELRRIGPSGQVGQPVCISCYGHMITMRTSSPPPTWPIW